MENVLDSFLVEIGFRPNKSQLANIGKTLSSLGENVSRVSEKMSDSFGSIGQIASVGLKKLVPALGDVGSSLTNVLGIAAKTGTALTAGFSAAFNLASSLLKLQAAITLGFSSLVVAIVATADHIANAELEYQLLGMHMMMTTEQAKRFKIASDAVGASLQDIAFNPELRARFEEMRDLMATMEKGFGDNYRENMRSIRDFFWDIKKLGVELTQGILPATLNKIFNRFGVTIEGVQEKFDSFVNSIAKNIGPISDWIADKLTPVLKDAQVIFYDLWETGKDLWMIFGDVADMFATLINVFSGGSSKIDQNANSFEKFAQILQTVVHGLAVFVHGMSMAEHAVMHMVDAVFLALHGKFKEALAEFKVGLSDIDGVSGSILGSLAGTGTGAMSGTAIGAVVGGALFSEIPVVGTAVGAAAGGTIGGLFGGVSGAAGGGFLGAHNPLASHSSGDGSQYDLKKLTDIANKYNIPPALLASLAQSESGIRQTDADGHVITSSTGALGVMQLLRSTARDLGVNPLDADQNVEGGAKYLSQQLARFGGNMQEAIWAYHDGPGAVENFLRGRGVISAEAQKEANTVLGRMNTNAYAAMSPQNTTTHNSEQNITIQTNIHLPPGSNARDTAEVVDNKIRQTMRDNAMININRLQSNN